MDIKKFKVVNCNSISQFKQALINKNNKQENHTLLDHNYRFGDIVLLRSTHV